MTLTLKDAALLPQQAYINGEWCGAADGRSYPVTQPQHR